MVIHVNEFPAINDGPCDSRLKGVRFYKETKNIPRKPVVYDPGICIVVQGHKFGYLGGQKFQYDANHYLVTSVTMPFECETFASPREPFLGLYIDVDMTQLHELISYMDIQVEVISKETGLMRGIGPAVMDDDMADAINRLIKCLQSETESRILGPGLVREILYRALRGTQASILYSVARHNGSFSRVASALKVMQTGYAAKFDVEQLAGKANMSTSAFHRAFKEMTSDSPMQYLKKLRLIKARDLMMQENMKAYIAADKVGYKSVSQFNREFKRYFGQNPARTVRESYNS
jgi:AraC-like DNA-binding protein